MKQLLYIDLFCGAGGTSTGINSARLNGEQCAEVIACVNHDANAIASHSSNHPDALHFTEDIRTLELSPEESKIHYLHPDKTVTHWGDKTSETLTFSEFKKQFFEEEPRKLSQETANCDYPVPNRLHIAAMAMQALLSNADRMKMYEDIASYPPSDNLTRIVARNALRYADALVAEAYKPTLC